MMTKDYEDFLQTVSRSGGSQLDADQDYRDEFAGDPDYANYYEEWC